MAGELQGVLASPPVAGSVTLRLDTGDQVTLSLSDDVVVSVFGLPAGLDALQVGANVKALYDDDLGAVVAIDAVIANQTFISGVVEAIVPKFRVGLVIPGAGEEGNLIVITPQGERVVLRDNGRNDCGKGRGRAQHRRSQAGRPGAPHQQL